MMGSFLGYFNSVFAAQSRVLGLTGQMPLANEAANWLDRAERAREVAKHLTDPAAKQAMIQAAKSYNWLARAAQRVLNALD